MTIAPCAPPAKAAPRVDALWRAKPRASSIVHGRLQEPRQAGESGPRLDIADHGHQSRRVDELVEGHVVQLELAGSRHHDAVEAFLDQRPIRPPAQLATEQYVEGLGAGQPA